MRGRVGQLVMGVGVCFVAMGCLPWLHSYTPVPSGDGIEANERPAVTKTVLLPRALKKLRDDLDKAAKEYDSDPAKQDWGQDPDGTPNRFERAIQCAVRDGFSSGASFQDIQEAFGGILNFRRIPTQTSIKSGDLREQDMFDELLPGSPAREKLPPTVWFVDKQLSSTRRLYFFQNAVSVARGGGKSVCRQWYPYGILLDGKSIVWTDGHFDSSKQLEPPVTFEHQTLLDILVTSDGNPWQVYLYGPVGSGNFLYFECKQLNLEKLKWDLSYVPTYDGVIDWVYDPKVKTLTFGHKTYEMDTDEAHWEETVLELPKEFEDALASPTRPSA